MADITPADITTSPAMPRVRPVRDWREAYDVNYRGVAFRVFAVFTGDRIDRWVVEGPDGERVCDCATDACALGIIRRNMDDAAELARAAARKAGKAVTHMHAYREINATVIPNRTIRLHGTCYGGPVEVTYAIGDRAEYDSYNLHYFGTIVGITAKTVTIDPGHGDRRRRLKIADFAFRNYSDMDAKHAQNADTMMHI